MRYLESALINLAKKVGRVSLENVASPTFHLRGSKKHVDATAQLVDGEFTLLEGSRIALNMDAAVNTWAETTKVQHATRQELRSKLFADGALRSEGAVAVATRDIVFSSPSAASATALVPYLLYALGPAK